MPAGKAGVVLDFGRQGQLSQRQGAGDAVFVRIGPLEYQGLQFRTSGVNGRRPGSRAAADDDHFFRHEFRFRLRGLNPTLCAREACAYTHIAVARL